MGKPYCDCSEVICVGTAAQLYASGRAAHRRSLRAEFSEFVADVARKKLTAYIGRMRTSKIPE